MEETDYESIGKLRTEKSILLFRGDLRDPSRFRKHETDQRLSCKLAKEHNLEYVQDELNNVVIYKPATPGLRECSYCDHSGPYGYGMREKT